MWQVCIHKLCMQTSSAWLAGTGVILVLCQQGVGDELHLVFECAALQDLRVQMPMIFMGSHHHERLHAAA